MKSNDFLNESEFIRHLDIVSSIASECFYLTDEQMNQFYYVQNNDLLLCGNSSDDAL